MTSHRRSTQYARSLLSMGEQLTLERHQGTDGTNTGGYHVDQYADPEPIQGLLRPGDIDVPYIDTKGRHGTADWWLIADATDDIGEQDRITLPDGFGTDGFGEGHFGAGSMFEVSLPRQCRIHGVEVFQLDEMDHPG